MSKNRPKIIAIILTLLILIGTAFLLANRPNYSVEPSPSKPASSGPHIVASNFISFDLARAIFDRSADISLLITPGTDLHHFEPTPQDIINVKNADLFIYVGDDSDQWIENLLQDNEISADHTIRLSDSTSLNDSDEHAWTSPLATTELINSLANQLATLFPENATLYRQNADIYSAKFQDYDLALRHIAQSSTKKLIFADHFPFQRLAEDYDLQYLAAFPGCAEETEPTAKLITALVNYAKVNNIHVILKTESTSDKLARLVAAEISTKIGDTEIAELNSAHNISQSDFEAGLTYANLMERNLKVLERALK